MTSIAASLENVVKEAVTVAKSDSDWSADLAAAIGDFAALLHSAVSSTGTANIQDPNEPPQEGHVLNPAPGSLEAQQAAAAVATPQPVELPVEAAPAPSPGPAPAADAPSTNPNQSNEPVQ